MYLGYVGRYATWPNQTNGTAPKLYQVYPEHSGPKRYKNVIFSRPNTTIRASIDFEKILPQSYYIP